MEAADHLLSAPNNWKSTSRWDSDSRSKHDSEYKWDFGLGWERTQELARKGWSEGAQNLSSKLAVHMPNNEHIDSWRYDVAGELPDIGRYLAGDPVHMRRHGHPKGHRPIISLFINNWITCMIKADQMANYGAALVAIVDQLENMGRRVELLGGTIAQSNVRRDVMMSATWKVKAAEDPLDLATVAFAVAHPAASRRFGWSLWETTAAPKDSGYGFGLGPDATEADLVDPLPGTLIIPGLKHNHARCLTLDDALAFASEQINSAAGEQLVSIEA